MKNHLHWLSRVVHLTASANACMAGMRWGGEGRENNGAWQHDERERSQERYCLTRLFDLFYT